MKKLSAPDHLLLAPMALVAADLAAIEGGADDGGGADGGRPDGYNEEEAWAKWDPAAEEKKRRLTNGEA